MHLSLVAAGAAAVLQALTLATAHAQAYPQRPVRMIIANGAGSAPDVIGRLLASKLAESWSQPVIVDNRPGATGLIAAELIAKAAPDGHTMFLSTRVPKPQVPHLPSSRHSSTSRPSNGARY